MEAAWEAGAEEGTILSSRGPGVYDTETFFSISVRSVGEMLLVLVELEKVRDILGVVGEVGRLDEVDLSTAFILSVDEVAGIVH